MSILLQLTLLLQAAVTVVMATTAKWTKEITNDQMDFGLNEIFRFFFFGNFETKG